MELTYGNEKCMQRRTTQMGTVKARDGVSDVREPEPIRARSTISKSMKAVLSSRTTQITPRFLPRRTCVGDAGQRPTRRRLSEVWKKPGLGNRARLCLRNYMEAEALSVYGGFHIVDTIPVFLPGGFL